MAVNFAAYEGQRRNIENQYTGQAATNAYARFLSQQRGERGIADYTRDYKRALPNVTAQYGKRNLAGGGIKSGVYQNAMKNYVGDYTQGYNRQQADMASELRQYDLGAANMTAERDRALAELEMQKAREIAEAAQALTALRPQYT